MRYAILSVLLTAFFSTTVSATPPGQYRLVLHADMISTSSAGGDFSALVDEQFDIGDPPSGEPVTPWKADWRHAAEFPVSATVDLGKELPLATLWIYYWRRSGEKLADYVTQRPFTGFVVVFIIFWLTFYLVYGLLNSGFPQPSELGL